MRERPLYIPSKQRSSLVREAMSKYPASCGYSRIYVVVEKDEEAKYREVVSRDDAEILILNDCNRGIAFSRNFCLMHADSIGASALVMADDDVVPDNLEGIYEYCEQNPSVGGVGAYQSYYGFSLGLDPGSGVVSHSRSMGMICFGGRVDNFFAVGGFDENLIRYSDYELRLKALKKGWLWFIHTDCSFRLVKSSHSEGGLASIGANTEKVQKDMYEILVGRHGDKVIKYQEFRPKNKVAFQWSVASRLYGARDD